ncbi:hypothetical protein E3N88_24271 [Mikania micrantha]|uniref:Uncharacterized protein n=1 Tax=Mikania micrantha TaxID=192012 RepID=A0A5N6NH98_9ASTR|nr:hypothetical protein E3N88_24271 [Mikania micrantha]
MGDVQTFLITLNAIDGTRLQGEVLTGTLQEAKEIQTQLTWKVGFNAPARGLGSLSSLLSQGELQSFCRLYQISASVNPRLPRPGDQVSACNDRVTVFTQVFKSCSVRYPLSPFLFSILRFFEAHFSQVHLFGLLRVMHFEIACRAMGSEPNIPLFRCFYQFRVDGDWFTFEKQRPQNFQSCVSRVLQSLRDWKLRFFFLNNNFLPSRLPIRNMQNPIVDEAPPLRDCDVPLFRLLVKNPTPVIVFPELVLVIACVSTLWDEPEFRPAVMEEGHEMNLVKILKKANRGMQFVAIEASIPPSLPPHMELLPVSPFGSAKKISSPDDDELPFCGPVGEKGVRFSLCTGVCGAIFASTFEASQWKKGKKVVEADMAVFVDSPIR